MSWAAAKRAVQKYGADNTTLLFTDTKVESPHLYRFLHDAAENVGAPLVIIAEGRTPWQVFNDGKMIGNFRADPCSRVLKREPGGKWLKENCDPTNTVIVFGIGWEEHHRLETVDHKGRPRGVRPRYASMGWPIVEAPMCDAPWMRTSDIILWAKLEGIEPSRSYAEGFLHDNCGGFCVKGGEGHFAHLLRMRPQVFAENEDEETAFNARRPGRRRQTVMAPQRMVGGTLKRVPMSMGEFRETIQNGAQYNELDIGGCGCFLDDEP